MRSSPLQLLKEHTFSKYFPSVGETFFGVLVHGFLRFLRIALIRASLAGSSNASVRVLAGSSNASVQVLAGSSNASVLSECHLRTVSIASCRRFSSLGFGQPLGSSAASRSSSRPGRPRARLPPAGGAGVRQNGARFQPYWHRCFQVNTRFSASVLIRFYKII